MNNCLSLAYTAYKRVVKNLENVNRTKCDIKRNGCKRVVYLHKLLIYPLESTW